MENIEGFELIIFYIPAVQFSIIATFSGKTYLRINSACRNKKIILKVGKLMGDHATTVMGKFRLRYGVSILQHF